MSPETIPAPVGYAFVGFDTNTMGREFRQWCRTNCIYCETGYSPVVDHCHHVTLNTDAQFVFLKLRWHENIRRLVHFGEVAA